MVDWPHRHPERTEGDARTGVCVLTHDAKFDIPLLRPALDLPGGYVGAMGSQRTHDERLHLLREAGVPEVQLARLRSPIGLDLGACTPEETALSITAEIISHANHATGLPLSGGTGPIHGPLARRRAAGAPSTRPHAPERAAEVNRSASARGRIPFWEEEPPFRHGRAEVSERAAVASPAAPDLHLTLASGFNVPCVGAPQLPADIASLRQ